jgi:biotin transport system substrate-specific component
MWAFEKIPGRKPVVRILSMIVALLVCYAFGTVWFMAVYMRTTGAVGLGTVLGWCVFPFIIPDLVKIALAYILSDRLRRFLPR